MRELALRPATTDDCARVWAWNFAPDVRAVSTDARIVALADHARWYAARLARADSPMWIVEDAGADVGVVRIDRGGGGDGDGRISIALARDARGRGVGRRAIAAACARWPGAVVAEVRHDNPASRACFEACGFAATDRHGDLVCYRKGATMDTTTEQLALWQSEFGRAYTDRNDHDNPLRVPSLARVLAGLAPTSVLEVGCNVGWNLTYLARLGLAGLHGVEPQAYAVARARARLGATATVAQGTAFALPFGDAAHDLVLTSGVLIHIGPADLPRALAEIYRVARRWIVAIEYDHPHEVEVAYRGRAGALWKRDHGAAWRAQFPALCELRTIPLAAGDGYDDCTAHVFAKPAELAP